MTFQTLPVNGRTHNVRFFDPVSGGPVNLTGFRLSSRIRFNWRINKGPDQVRLGLNLPYYTDVQLEGLNVIIDVVNDKYPLGKVVFQGVVDKVNFNIDGGAQTANLQCTGESSFLAKTFLRFRWAGGGGLNFQDTLPISEFLTNIIDEFNINYPSRQLSTTGIDANPSIAFYKGNSTNMAKAISDIVKQSPEDWFILFDAQRNVIFTDQFDVHNLTLGRDVTSISIARSLTEIINSVSIGYETGGTPLRYLADNSTSITQFELSEFSDDFGDQFDLAAATNYGDKILSENDNVKISGTITVNAKYNFEDIKPGDRVRVRNTRFGNSIFDGLLKVVSITYQESFATLQIQEEQDDFVDQLKKAIN